MRYPGGKAKNGRMIAEAMPTRGRDYIEPFCGIVTDWSEFCDVYVSHPTAPAGWDLVWAKNNNQNMGLAHQRRNKSRTDNLFHRGPTP